MDRHARPQLQRALTSGSLQGDQLSRSSTDPRSGRSKHLLGDEELNTRQTSRDSKRPRGTSANLSPEGMPFACPYAKYDPTLYSHSHKNASDEHEYRNCSTGYWTSIARLKQHLYRTHDRSLRCCEQCWQNFPNDESLRRHVSAQTCDSKPMPVEKMDKQQHHLVKERVQGKPVESWYKIYTILFPDDEDLPASPYAEWVTGEDLRNCFELLMGRLPRLLFQTALSKQPQVGNVQQKRDTNFPTSAADIQRALIQCQREFGQATGLSHVFASGPPASGNSAVASSSREQGAVPASRIQTTYGHQPQGHARSLSVNTTLAYRMQNQELEEDDSSSSSSTEMNIDDQMIQAMQAQTMASRGQSSYPVTTSLALTSASYAAITGPPTDEDILQARLIQEKLFPPYHGYGWSE